MKFYLSSFGLGDEAKSLVDLSPNKKIGYINNARDFTGADMERKAKRAQTEIAELASLGLEVEKVDLKKYFDRSGKLKEKIRSLAAVFVSGGNVFVLRQAFKLSGLDHILQSIEPESDFLYAGYSAGVCVLSPNLKAYDIVDPLDTPYPQQSEIIWDGVGLIDFAFMPHWQSDHPESALIEKEIAYCEENKITYRALRDGEVIQL